MGRFSGELWVNCFINVLKSDIQDAAGPLQTSVGLKAGIEASIPHVNSGIYQTLRVLYLLMQTMRSINRQLAIHNIRELCPPFHQYISNTHQKPARLVVCDGYKTECMASEEGLHKEMLLR